ncbi:MAG: hypothetical protein QXT81_03805 [Candidatus Bathyarchaeia archaeon]
MAGNVKKSLIEAVDDILRDLEQLRREALRIERLVRGDSWPSELS